MGGAEPPRREGKAVQKRAATNLRDRLAAGKAFLAWRAAAGATSRSPLKDVGVLSCMSPLFHGARSSGAMGRFAESLGGFRPHRGWCRFTWGGGSFKALDLPDKGPCLACRGVLPHRMFQVPSLRNSWSLRHLPFHPRRRWPHSPLQDFLLLTRVYPGAPPKKDRHWPRHFARTASTCLGGCPRWPTVCGQRPWPTPGRLLLDRPRGPRTCSRLRPSARVAPGRLARRRMHDRSWLRAFCECLRARDSRRALAPRTPKGHKPSRAGPPITESRRRRRRRFFFGGGRSQVTLVSGG